VSLFKTHIWGLIQYHTAAIYHACATHLAKFDHLQSSFLRDLGISAVDAFLQHNFAPLSARRDIAMLAVLHKRVLGIGHLGFARLFPFSDFMHPRGHDKQLTFPHHHVVHFQQCLWHRSLFALVIVYNRLPQIVVDSKSIKDFQRALTDILRHRCSANPDNDDWISVFDPLASND